MSEMVERVARALCTLAGHDPDGPTSDIYVPNDPVAHMPWAGYRSQARAAIVEMREPTGEMCRAGEYDDHGLPGEDHYITERDAEGVWERMIDAALTPTPPSP